MPPQDDMQPTFPPVYFSVRFRAPPSVTWPERFVIVTAWATTGECWTDAENHAADARLVARLRELGTAPIRVTGYAPQTGHAEPGWAIALDPDAALCLGRSFRQHAIYAVDGDALQVVRCEDARTAPVGSFRDRVDPPGRGGEVRT
jgi:hypothetical protein